MDHHDTKTENLRIAAIQRPRPLSLQWTESRAVPTMNKQNSVHFNIAKYDIFQQFGFGGGLRSLTALVYSRNIQILNVNFASQ